MHPRVKAQMVSKVSERKYENGNSQPFALVRMHFYIAFGLSSNGEKIVWQHDCARGWCGNALYFIFKKIRGKLFVENSFFLGREPERKRNAFKRRRYMEKQFLHIFIIEQEAPDNLLRSYPRNTKRTALFLSV